MKYTKSTIFYLSLLLPVTILIVLIYKFGYCFPYWDEILYLPLFDKLNQGTLSIYDLFAFQNDHRPFFPRIITLILAKLTSWNELVILYFSVALVVSTFLIFVYIITSKKKEEKLELIENRDNKRTRQNYLVGLSICFISLFLFSWSQMENWVWGLQLMVFMTNFLYALILFIFTVYELNLLTLSLCVILATLASFSFANGLLIWFTTLPLLLYKISKTRGKKSLLLLIWILCTVTVYIFYFTHYHPPKITATNTNTGIMHKIQYFLLYIGNPISGFVFTPPWHGSKKLPDINILSYIFGIIGLLLWILLLYKTREVNIKKEKVCKFEKGMQILSQVEKVKPNIEEYFFWLSLSLFALLSGILVSFGRSGLGLGQALSSRYITISALFWCSLIGLLNFYIKNSEKSVGLRRKNKYIERLALGILFAIFIILNFTPIYINQEWHQIARWKNLGWYALCSGYNGKLYWTDLWGNYDFTSPQVIQKEIFPIFHKYNLASINHFKREEVKKQLAKIYLNEANYFIENRLWKPAVCYLDTAIYLDPSIAGVEEIKGRIPPENFTLYEKYQKGTK